MKNTTFGNIEWNESLRNFTGLPRPFSKVLKHHRTNRKLSAKVPIPWQSAAKNDDRTFLRIIQENEDIVYYKNLCSYCGIKINDEENVVKWKNPHIDKIIHDGPFVLSDIHPLHLECMRQTRIYCPGMRKRIEDEFEYDIYLNLKQKSKKERDIIINNNILTLTNVFYFSTDLSELCKKLYPLIKEINKDREGLKFQIIDADIDKDLAKRFNIKLIPTIIIINKGEEIKRLVGLQTKEALQLFLNFAENYNYKKIIQKNV